MAGFKSINKSMRKSKFKSNFGLGNINATRPGTLDNNINKSLLKNKSRISTNNPVKTLPTNSNFFVGPPTKENVGNFSSADMKRMKAHDDMILKQRQQKASEELARKSRLKTKLGVGVGLGATGLYAGADLVDRYRSGGNLTRNGNNEKDIVGVPFL